MSETKPYITILQSRYDELLDCELKLLTLEQSGVDNWDWYGDAMEQYEQWKEEAKGAEST